LEDFLKHLRDHFHDFLANEIDYSTLRTGKYKDSIILINQSLRGAAPEEREAVKNELLATPLEEMFDFEHTRQTNREAVVKVHDSMRTSGVFCSTKKYDSLLMWAHYAQKHEGAVLKFSPDAFIFSCITAR